MDAGLRREDSPSKGGWSTRVLSSKKFLPSNARLHVNGSLSSKKSCTHRQSIGLVKQNRPHQPDDGAMVSNQSDVTWNTLSAEQGPVASGARLPFCRLVALPHGPVTLQGRTLWKHAEKGAFRKTCQDFFGSRASILPKHSKTVPDAFDPYCC